jgi:cytochrome b subunit of formate dehydrogenase
MEAAIRVRRLTGIDRLPHIFLIVTLIILAFAGTAEVLIDNG